MNDDPLGFAENQRKQIAYEVSQGLAAKEEEKETQSKLDRTFSEYSKNNPDNEDKTGFVQMWESGKIQPTISPSSDCLGPRSYRP